MITTMRYSWKISRILTCYNTACLSKATFNRLKKAVQYKYTNAITQLPVQLQDDMPCQSSQCFTALLPPEGKEKKHSTERLVTFTDNSNIQLISILRLCFISTATVS